MQDDDPTPADPALAPTLDDAAAADPALAPTLDDAAAADPAPGRVLDDDSAADAALARALDDAGAADAALARALDAWTPLAPPADFADRVLAARDAASPSAPRAPRARHSLRRRLVIGATAATAVAAAAIAALVLRTPRTAAGAVVADRRTTTALGDRAVAVAEPGGELTWRIASDGAADVVQRSGDVFYRVERGGPFVVHTPAGDIRITGTCFRIEVDPMNTTHKLLLSGLAGAALATTVLVTVYEGHVIAETRAAKTELAAGTHATLTGDSTTVADPPLTTLADDARATREQLLVRTREQQAQLLQLRARLAQLEHGAPPPTPGDTDAPEPGRAWHDPSPEKLASWVATCHVRTDEPSLDRFTPGSQLNPERGVAPGELADYDAAMTEMAKRWKDLVRSLYLETTGDTVGADTLSSESMTREIEDKSPPGEHNLILQRLARERAGLAAPPTDLARTSALERLTRAHAQLGDQSEAALAKRLGPARAHAIRGDGWQSRSDSSGCPDAHP